MADSVYYYHFRCERNFKHLLDHLPASPPAITGHFPLSEATNEHGRYKVWAENVGAHQYGPNYKLSLDYRLRDAGFYKDQLVKLLLRLEQVLQRAVELIRTTRRPTKDVGTSDQDRTSGKDDSSQSSSASFSSDSDWAISDDDEQETSGQSQPPGNTISNPSIDEQDKLHGVAMEASQLLSSLKLTITNIYKMPVRRPAPIERLDRLSKKHSQDMTLYHHFDCLYVQDLFKEADPRLTARLGRLITRRRQVFQYRKAHSEHLKQEIKDLREQTIIADQLMNYAEDVTRQPGLVADPSAATKTYAESGTHLTEQRSSHATTFRPGALNVREEEVSIIELRSLPETISSWASTHTNEDPLSLPPRPQGVNGDDLEDFECPYCYTLVYVRSQHAWKKHIFLDLEPYVCTFNCELSNHTFGTRQEWYQHERQNHRSEYSCNHADHDCYTDRFMFFDHMKRYHGTDLDHVSNTNHLGMFVRPKSTTKGVCCLCGVEARMLDHHLARHLERIALFALPRDHDITEDSQEGNSDISKQRIRRFDDVDAQNWSSSEERGSGPSTDSISTKSAKNTLSQEKAKGPATTEGLKLQASTLADTEAGQRQSVNLKLTAEKDRQTATPLLAERWLERLSAISSETPLILVMGPRGCGKSTFIDAASNKPTGITRPDSSSIDIDSYSCTIEGREVTLIETTSFGERERDSEVLSALAYWMRVSYHDNERIAGIVYLHSISDIRLYGPSRVNYHLFKAICGDEGYQKVALTTTKWDVTPLSTALRREGELTSNTLFLDVIDYGAMVYRYPNSEATAAEIVTSLLLRGPQHFVPQLQKELVLDGKKLSETKAGLYLQNSILDKVKPPWSSKQKEDSAKTDDEESWRIIFGQSLP